MAPGTGRVGGQITSAPGRPAHAALTALVHDAKAGDAMAPVTVIVPTRRSALALRRELAGAGGGAPVGLVNVRFEVAGQIAHLLGARRLAADGRRHLDDAVLHEAVRGVLASDPGPFRASAGHAATIERVAHTYRELRAAPTGAVAGLRSASHRGSGVAAVCSRIEAALAAWYDDADLVRAASLAIERGDPEVAELGPVICFAPHPADRLTAALLAALGARATVLALDEPAASDQSMLTGLRVASVSDPDEEARAAVHEVLALVVEGTPLHRIAIAHPAERYAAVLHQHLDRAGVPHHGASVRRLAQTVGGITLVGLVDLAADDLRRDRLVEWLSSVPVLDPATGAPAPVASWDVESRRAGVIGGAAQWATRLARRVDELTPAAGRPDTANLLGDVEAEAHAERNRARVALIQQLDGFVASLARILAGARVQSWTAWSRWAMTALVTYLGDEQWRARWPDDEIEAFDQLAALLTRLALLDGLAPPPDRTTFAATLATVLDTPAGRLGTFGDGVHLGSIRSMAGLAFDAVIVLGGAEGALPHRTPTDPLLGEHERAAAGLGEPGGSVAEQRRDFFLALATAGERRVVLVPRGDLRSDRAYVPSRWVVELIEAGIGHPLAATEITADETAGLVHNVRSFADGLANLGLGASSRERALQALWASAVRGQPLERSAPALADRQLRNSLAAQRARAEGGFTEHDGRVGPTGSPEIDDGPLSPTSLQQYAQCPRRYFLAKVLGLSVTERPEEVTRIAATTRGSLVHAILERWVADRIHGVPGAEDPSHLLAVAEAAFADLEAHGLAGRPLPWAFDQTVILRELAEIAARDTGDPLAVELAFGLRDQPPVRVPLPDGTSVAFRGSVDRVDRSADGALQVTDYKTGGKADYRTLVDTTVERGELLQLPIYALAARDRFGDPDTPVRAAYWFVTERAGFERIGYAVDQQRLEVLSETLGVVVDGIRAGRFPARPGPFDTWTNNGKNCNWCEFNAICPTDRIQQWARSSAAPELTAYVQLAEGPAAPVAAQKTESGGQA